MSFMAQSLVVRSIDQTEDWRDLAMPILATEVSRAFVPPCTRATSSRAAALGPADPLGGAGTLAANSAPTKQWLCQCKTRVPAMSRHSRCLFAGQPA